MTDSVYKIIELVGTSTESWEKAAKAAVDRASQSLRDLRIAEITQLDMHLKDLTDLRVRDSQVAVGEGKIPIPGVFRALQSIKYAGYVNLEYEINAKDPLPGMQVSFAYMRGVLAGQSPTVQG